MKTQNVMKSLSEYSAKDTKTLKKENRLIH